ncbi:MAG: hypothetical protein Q8R45_08035 [Brevundimonas sp.]|nr:hypothetical protein [Brevundimonas sp.]MDO9587553.1 hypothetical protein [Brevundimonas sp.]MDP3369258.1 hypothetical protein [Brevundimonas sp.]MDP3656897.1 hypothetical protein [Brevundimonas sp.]MDZ4111642.1 hypothetical protein [Brevundimonas sp.]
MAIDELEKPMGSWCNHCSPGSGCKIYDQRPPSCRTFQCLWLVDPGIPETLKPNRSKVIFDQDTDGTRLIVRCDASTPNAWRDRAVYDQIKLGARYGWRRGMMVVVTVERRLWLIAPNEDIDLGIVDPRSPFAVQERRDGSIQVRILPRLDDNEEFDAAVSAARLGWQTPK